MTTPHRTTRVTRKGIIALTALLTVVFAGLTLYEHVHGGRGTVFAGMASAEPSEPAAQTGEPDKAAPAPAIPADQGPDPVTTAPTGDENKGIFVNDSLESLALTLKKKEKELQKREEALKEEEKRLEALRAEVEQNLARMDETLKKMEAMSAQADASKEEALNQWVGIYQTMAPADVAKIIEGVDEDFAIRLLSAMVPKKAGEVLSAISPEASIKLSKHLTERQ